MAPKKRPPIERFMDLVRQDENGCWVWTGYIQKNGYARHWVNGKNTIAHRWSYEHHIGPIPDGLQIDHLCRNRACVNPAHLEPVTPAENSRRSTSPQLARMRQLSKTHCPYGHEYTEENTYRGSRGRTCLKCRLANRKKNYAENRDHYIAKAAEWRKANPERARELSREGQKRYRDRLKGRMADGHLGHNQG